MDSFVQQMRNLGPARLAALAGVAIGLLGFLVYFATRLGTPPMERLFGDLSTADAKAIISELESQKVPFELRNNGTEIAVPSSQVLKLRVQLAEKASATGGAVGYEVFDQMDSLGATNFMQNVNQVRALEGELARTIMAIEGVKAARVHLVMPKREVFTRETQDPSAAVFIKMHRGRLSREQANAVQRLIAASVPRLKPARISIVDDRGTLLTPGMEDEGVAKLNTQEEMRRREEARLARSLEQLLENVVGLGKIRAEVRADIDFDKVVTNQEIYDPEAQVARSTVNRQESNESSENDPGNVSVANNLPNAQTASGGPAATSRENRTEETTNFEISRKVTNQVKEGPQIRRLSVAVLVDGIYSTGDNGERQFQPRPAEEMDKLAAIVRSAIGFDAARGDQVELVNMQFQALDEADLEAPWMFMGFTKPEVMRMAESFGVAIVAILIILMVVRPLVARAFEGMAASEDNQLLTADGMPNAQLSGPAPIPEEEDISDELIDIDKVEGRVKASSLRKIGEIVDKHPEEAVSIIRNWLYQEAA
ncbi:MULTISPECIES: flagellar basal-body MS-ring/collar protein FliF [unclassified Haematospirillum]|uniref:flagellar basal-body MS-ring/collar protein FliF n=1 Tax=unclassified Haematospirillum TaxID=2622088 RepID=UPI00143B35A8|nr:MULTISPECIES: flagellar basal-body MS-ring/collar protein FliF [unclassified Haematospirillum]NKD54459.1 flagellar M-ring protein FliF [Haematospirillum sp. H4890]NKD74502.1 flagellar M-ring protein FliF [Haematospirillum sp. H4485]NKD86825.1 flagellar M-ring protein FliF [Haematospirillum sp. 15-248]